MKPVFSPNPNASVLVVGDIILDRYVHGITSRISPEAPVPVVHVRQIEDRPGGAGNVALNISSLGLDVYLVGLTGNDDAAAMLKDKLQEKSVACHFLQNADFPTITKQRVMSQHQQLLRLDYESYPEPDLSGELYMLFQEILNQSDVVVLSDYAKGSLAQIEKYIAACNSASIKVLIDPKGNDFERYRGATLLTPNLKEFEMIVGPCSSNEDLVTKGGNLCDELELESLLVTQGENGMTLISGLAGAIHLEVVAREVFDVTGAGDTVIATMASAIASGYDFSQSALFANRAAGLVVAKSGTASVTIEEINRETNNTRDNFNTILEATEIENLVKSIKGQGESIVMTNGCFDILHAGHVEYLKQARKLGDHLLVAVNDDASVNRLKGENRPVNSLEHRMSVLAALKPVDWVVAFSEETPEKLINKVLPDVLVKGGDYTPEQIAGADIVKSNGGIVKIIPLLEGCSTTNILQRVNRN